MHPNRPTKTMPSQYCLCFALLGLLIGAIYLSLIPFIEQPKFPDYWVLVSILWVLVGVITLILLLQHFMK